MSQSIESDSVAAASSQKQNTLLTNLATGRRAAGSFLEAPPPPILDEWGTQADNACGCGANNMLRVEMLKLVKAPSFDVVSTIIIIANTAFMCLEPSPQAGLPPTPGSRNASHSSQALMNRLELLFNLAFTAELFVRACALGLHMDRICLEYARFIHRQQDGSLSNTFNE